MMPSYSLVLDECRGDSKLLHPNPLGMHPPTREAGSPPCENSRSNTRRISASFGTGGVPSSQPTVATSSLTASKTTTSIAGGSSYKHNNGVKVSSGLRTSNTHGSLLPVPTNRPYQSPRKSTLSPTNNVPRTGKPAVATTTFTTATGALQRMARNDENIPPRDSSSVASLAASTVASSSKPSFETAKSMLNLSRGDTNNFKAAASQGSGATARGGGGGVLPKSRTLNNVFSNLSHSLSRNSLASSFSRTPSISSKLGSDASSIRSASNGTDLRQGSASVLATSRKNLRQIDEPKSSAYWTGRFVALMDRFHSEMLLPGNLTTMTIAHADRSIVGQMPPPRTPDSAHFTSSTSNPVLVPSQFGTPAKRGHNYTSSISSTTSKGKSKDVRSDMRSIAVEAEMLSNEDNRAHRAFLHLEALCTTSEAKRSLHAWQQKYARKMRKPELLPKGGTMEEKGWMGRLLGRGKDHRSSVAGLA